MMVFLKQLISILDQMLSMIVIAYIQKHDTVEVKG